MDPRSIPANGRVVAATHAADFPNLRPVEPANMRVTAAVANLLSDPAGPRERQLLSGSLFEALETRDGYVFGSAPALGGYVGWIAMGDLATQSAPNHFVCARQSHAYPEPNFKTRELAALPLLAGVHVNEFSGRFARTEFGWVPSAHLRDHAPDDPVAIAELFIGAPYLWGGNSIWGLDCSGLVHAALTATGHACPGDADQQEQQVGRFLSDRDTVQRGDLYFWKGHVAMAVDGDTLIHANAHAMAVTLEPIDAAISRISAQGDGPVTSRKRFLE